MSAERAGAYKMDPRAYQAALRALRLPADRVLFVAGSAHDVPGASRVGMKVYWSNRQRLAVPPGSPSPLADEPDLRRLPDLAYFLRKGRRSSSGFRAVHGRCKESRPSNIK